MQLEQNKPNKALQPTPTRYVPTSYDRPAFLFTFSPELGRLIGVAELGVRLQK